MGKNFFLEAKRNSARMVLSAAILLALASASLFSSSLFPSTTAFFVGQILFVILVFSAVCILVVTAIAQDVHHQRRGDGI